VFADLRRHRGIVPVPGVLIVRPDAPLFYANAELVRDAIEQAAVSSAEPVRAVVLVLDGNDEIDITTAEQLGKLAAGLRARNVPLGLAHVHGPVLEMAERSGLLATVGADHVFPATPAAVAWARSVADAPVSGLASTADPG
jgi:MFS superfamily sulfate permease-like transporter